MPIPSRTLLAALLLFTLPGAGFAQKEYGFDNTKPSGQPYLKPEESVKRMKVPEGFEVKLFAAEPMVINPIAFTIDERGRVWVVECFEYPSRTPPGKMPRDRIVILEDTDGDGIADKRTVFAEGKDFPMRFDMASGIEVGYGGCFLGAPPYLWHLKDTDGDGKADKFEILLKGFGSEDTHETLNSFTWGPDGWLYGLHGIFTQSTVKATDGNDDGVKMNAAVWRYHPRTKKFEIFAEGTSNPWGMDFDSNGNCFLCCCVIPHLFHIIPGGIYKRQAGTSFHSYAYGELSEICDHTFHKESGWAHAGLLCLDNPLMPEQYRTSVIFGSIHGCSIKRNVLRRNGSTFVASKAEDFLVSGDKNFRPISLRWGPDGSIYVSDWHDQNPCHQAKPDSWDYEHGRIYRIVRKGQPARQLLNWSRMDANDLSKQAFQSDNPWAYRTAVRLLREKQTPGSAGNFGLRIDNLQPRMAWWLSAVNGLNEHLYPLLMSNNAGENMATTRAWIHRLYLQSPTNPAESVGLLALYSRQEKSPVVRLELACLARQYAMQNTLLVLHDLLRHSEDATDPAIPFMLWLAYEPKLAEDAKKELEWLKANAPGNPLITQHIIPRAMRRLVATGKAEDLAACVEFLGSVTDVDVQRQALRGLLQAFSQQQFNPPPVWAKTYATLREQPNEEIRRMAGQLAAHFRDKAAIDQALLTMKNVTLPVPQRREAIEALALARPLDALAPLLEVLQSDPSDDLRRAAAIALARFNDPLVPQRMLAKWKTYPPTLRLECVNTLKSRRAWAKMLLEAVGKGDVLRTDLTDQTILAISNFRDPNLQRLIEKVWGRFRPTPAELEALIVRMRKEMNQGTADPQRGKQVFEKNCMQCHKFQGQGHDVGPNLDGAERSIEYLLANVLDPNRVVGQPYFTRVVLRKNGTLVTGLVHAEDGQTLTLKRENNVLEVIPKAEIDEMKTEEKSLMPEGLANNMTAQDFRDLVRYLIANPFISEVQVLKDPQSGFANLPAESETEPWKSRIDVQERKTGPAGKLALDQSATAKPGSLEPMWFQYVQVEIQAAAEMNTRLMVGTNGPVVMKVWLNGKLVQEVKDLRKDLPATPDQRSMPVTLNPGVNRLLIRYGNSNKEPALFLRVVDSERKLGYAIPKNAQP